MLKLSTTMLAVIVGLLTGVAAVERVSFAETRERNWVGPPPYPMADSIGITPRSREQADSIAAVTWENTPNASEASSRTVAPNKNPFANTFDAPQVTSQPFLEEAPAPMRVWPPPEVMNPALAGAVLPEGQARVCGEIDEEPGDLLPGEYYPFDPRLESASTKSAFAQHEWQLLPRGLMYQSYLAGPREPRFGYAWLYDTRNETWVNDAAIGGRLGVLRFGDHDPFLPEGWQLDIEGAAFPRLAETSLDLIATDYRFGIPLTSRRGPYQWKLAFYHLSSHVGDEYLLNTAPGFDRINFSRNAMVLGLGYFVTADLRLYAETGYGFLNDGGNQPWEFQFGAEYRPFVPTGWRGRHSSLPTHTSEKRSTSAAALI